jgi:hypothetical protein
MQKETTFEFDDSVEECELFVDQRQYVEFMATLKLLGCTQVQIEFSGGGDSGEIQQAQAWGNGKPIDLTQHTMQFTYTQEVWSAEPGKPARSKQQVTEEKNLGEVLKSLCEDALEETGIDWYNNDGGSGCFYVDYGQDPPRLRLEVETYYTTSDNHDFDY